MVKVEALKTEILEQFSVVIKDELKQLCSTNNPSVLRKTSKEDLINFSWDSVHKELQEKTPTVERFARACVENPSQSRNAHKKDEALDAPIGDVTKVPFTTFLPSTAEQELLSEELALVVCHMWATHIPSLSWFADCVLTNIPHKHMDDMKKKTNKVS